MRSKKAGSRSFRGERPARQNGVATRERILDAAEALFARDGFEATSLRSIAREAAVNQAGVHYHFRGKQELFGAVYERRFGPFRDTKLRALEALREEGAEGDVERLVRALFRPVLESWRKELSPGVTSAALFARMFTEPGPHWDEALQVHRRTVQKPFVEALGLALPELARDELLQRLDFCQGAVLHLCVDRSRSPINAPWRELRKEPERFERHVVALVVNLLTAPPSTGVRS